MRLTDTLTTEKIELVPLAQDGVVRLYVCGITPYSESHVGHQLSYQTPNPLVQSTNTPPQTRSTPR